MENSNHIIAGVGEKIQYTVHDYNDNTIRFILHYPKALDARILSKATKILVDSVDILHGTFTINSFRAYWEINEEYEESCYFQLLETQDDVMEKACKIALLPIETAGKVQMHCSLVQGVMDCAVVLRISHLCVDGSDGNYLLHKLSEAYRMVANGTSDHLEIKNGNRAAEQVYEELSTKEYMSLLRNPISKVKSEFVFPTEEPGEPCMIRAGLDEELMNRAHTYAKELDASVNDLLLAAVYHAYVKTLHLSPDEPVSIMSMMDLRRHCKNGQTEGLCNISGCLPTTLDNGIGKTLTDTLLEVSKQTHIIKDDPLAGLAGMPVLHRVAHSLPMGVLLFAAGKLYGNFSMGVTNMGNVSCKELAMDEVLPDEGVFAGPLKKKPGVQISIASFDGKCALTIVGQYTKEDAKLLQEMLNDIVEEIEKILK